jgi:16S rRNA G966 N2-methylase RsmD
MPTPSLPTTSSYRAGCGAMCPEALSRLALTNSIVEGPKEQLTAADNRMQELYLEYTRWRDTVVSLTCAMKKFCGLPRC